jgi:polyphosphate kinase
VSIVGRYLEHARILRFGRDHGPKAYYIGSADLMPRNLDRRVETLTPVTDQTLQARLDEIIEVNLEDDMLAWELSPDGSWVRVPTTRSLSTHQRLQDLARARMQGDA